MRVFVAGATGAIGRQLVPKLVAAGHEVTGMTRSAHKADAVRALGATPVVADALDADQVARAVAQAQPEAIVHQLTAIPSAPDLRRLDRDFELTNRLRREGTDHLLAAGREAGARRFVAQSFSGNTYERAGEWVKTEADPLDPTPPAAMRETNATIRYLEAAVTGAHSTEGIVLRYANFYGPGTTLDRSAVMPELIRKRRLPLLGDAAGMWSFIHTADAAEATVAALERGQRGIYNVADDDPARVAEWLPALAEMLGAKPPRRVPLWLGRLLAGEPVAVVMTENRGVSNAKAKRELRWEPRRASWRDGLASELA